MPSLDQAILRLRHRIRDLLPTAAIEEIEKQYDDFRMGLRQPFLPLGRWITEIGAPSDGAVGSELEYATNETQRQRLRELYFSFAHKNNIESFIVHQVQDSNVAEFGVVRADQTASCKSIYFILADFVSTNAEPVNPTCPAP